MGPSVEEMLSGLQKEVSECRTEQAKYFSERFKQYISESTKDLECISLRATALHHRILNPPPELRLTPSFAAIPITSFTVPDLTSDVQHLFNLHTNPAFAAGNSRLPRDVFDKDASHAGMMQSSASPASPTDTAQNAGSVAVAGGDSKVSAPQGNHPDEHPNKPAIRNKAKLLKGPPRNVSKRTSTESGSSGFHTPLSSSPSPAARDQGPDLAIGQSHTPPTQAGSARVTPVRTRRMKQSDGEPIGTGSVRARPASRRLSFAEGAPSHAHRLPQSKEGRSRANRDPNAPAGKLEQSIHIVKHSPQLEEVHPGVDSNNPISPAGTSDSCPRESPENNTDRPVKNRRVKRRKNLIIESPESASSHPADENVPQHSDVQESAKQLVRDGTKVQLMDVNTGETNEKTEWLLKHARTTVNLDDYINDGTVAVDVPKADSSNPSPNTSPDRTAIDSSVVRETPKIYTTLRVNESNEGDRKEARHDVSRPCTLATASGRERTVKDDGHAAGEISNEADVLDDQPGSEKPLKKIKYSGSRSENEFDECERIDNRTQNLGREICEDGQQNPPNAASSGEMSPSPVVEENLGHSVPSEPSDQVSTQKVLDNSIEATDDEKFESALSQECSFGDVNAKTNSSLEVSKCNKKSVSFRDSSAPSRLEEPQRASPCPEPQPSSASFEVRRDGKISTSAVDELFKMMSVPSRRKDTPAGATPEIQPITNGSNLQPHESASEDGSSQRVRQKKLFSSKQSSCLRHTPGARPPIEVRHRREPQASEASHEEPVPFILDAATRTNQTQDPNEAEHEQTHDPNEAEPQATSNRTHVASVLGSSSTNEGFLAAFSPGPKAKPQKLSGAYGERNPDHTSPKPQTSNREDAISRKIQQILSSAPTVKSEAKLQMERVRAERYAAQSAKKSITRTAQSKFQHVGSRSGFAYRVPEFESQPLSEGLGQFASVDPGQRTPPRQSHLISEDERDLEPRVASGDFSNAPGPSSRDDTLEQNHLSGYGRVGSSFTTVEAQEQDPDNMNISATNFNSLSGLKRKISDQLDGAPSEYNQSNKRPARSPVKNPVEHGAGSALMNLVTSVTSFLPSASDFVGWRQQITEDDVKESPEEIAERQRLDAERREAEIQARREALRIQKQREIEEKQRRAETKRKALAEEERQREEQRRLKEQLRLKKKREEEEERKRKKLEEEKKREERRQQVLLKRKQMQENFEREKALEAKRMKEERHPKSAVEFSLSDASNSRNAGRSNIQDQECRVPRMPRIKASGSSKGEASSYMMTPAKETIIEHSDDEAKRRRGKHVPRWAKSGNVMKAVEANETDPDELFANAPMCNLADLFGDRRRYRTRSSSGNWAFDRLTAQEKLMYKKATRGFDESER